MSNRPTIMEVNLENLKYNSRSIKKYLGNSVKMMPVIKANAYGTYLNFCDEVMKEFDIVGVALVDEGIHLRKNNYRGDIFVLNQPYIEEIDNIIDNDIVVGISDFSFLRELAKRNKRVRVHLEIETGMNRTGIMPINIDSFLDELSNCANILVEGIYTHLSSADNDLEYTNTQLNIFSECVKKIEERLGKIKYIHCCASNGIINFSNSFYNLVRVGILLYGYESCCDAFKVIDLKPVCKLKSKITFLKEVDEGVSIGYARKYITKRKSKIATIPIGYADGINRNYDGYVVINKMKMPIVGNICMDSLMIDVTDIEAKVGDDVYIWDNDIVKVEDIAESVGTINYEILSTISSRVPRKFI